MITSPNLDNEVVTLVSTDRDDVGVLVGDKKGEGRGRGCRGSGNEGGSTSGEVLGRPAAMVPRRDKALTDRRRWQAIGHIPWIASILM